MFKILPISITLWLADFYSWWFDSIARRGWPSKCISGAYSPFYQFTGAKPPDLSFANLQPPPPNDLINAKAVRPDGNDNDFGDINHPWQHIKHAAANLKAGQVAYVYPGVYNERITTVNPGHSNAPIWLIAEHGPQQNVILQDPTSTSTDPFIRINQEYWIIDGFEINAHNSKQPPTPESGEAIRFKDTFCVLVRNIHAYSGFARRAVLVDNSTDVAILKSTIHNYAFPGKDSHAIAVTNGSERVLINDNECYDNAGDAVQCLDPTESGEMTFNPPKHVTIEGNRFHDNDENAVDLKTCYDITVRGNKFYGYRPSTASAGSSPKGDAIVVQKKANRILIEGNYISHSGRAISIGTDDIKTGHVIFRRNVVHDMVVAQIEVKDASGNTKLEDVADTGSGVDVSQAKQVEIYHNTFYNLPSSRNPGITSGYAIRIGGQSTNNQRLFTDLASILNNIVMNAGINMYINLPDIGKLVSDHNIFFPAQSFRINTNTKSLADWKTSEGYDCSSIDQNPLFKAAGDFSTQQGSPARDKAIPIRLYREILNFCDSGPDIGAIESC